VTTTTVIATTRDVGDTPGTSTIPDTAAFDTAGISVPALAGAGLTDATFTPGGAWGGALAPAFEAAPDPAFTLVPTPAPELSDPPSPEHPPSSEHGVRGRRWLQPALLACVTAAVVVAVALVERPLPALSLRRSIPTSLPVAGAAPVLPWPATGEAAVAVPSLGVSVQSGPEQTVPIASLAKLMTAYVTLRDHPLAPDAQGPIVTMTAADQAESAADGSAGATSVPVLAGEQLSERQILGGLMVHSANNLADVLARWDAGTVPAFVAQMNVAAAALGMAHTHYADASGLNPGTAGSAGDQLRVTAAAMAIPTFAAVVAQPTVTLPVAGVLYNYVQAVGTDGIVGVKSGFTQAAMGCLVLAAERTVAGHRVLVLAAVTGQPGSEPLEAASQADVSLIDAVASGVREVPVMARLAPVASITLPWDHKKVPVVSAQPVSLLAWPGQVMRVRIARERVHTGVPAGARVATLSVSDGPERVSVPVRVVHSLSGPSTGWRLTGR
jgi:D-alanyl-D-alanine carboxypeptidase (penicillin-binding protein 5/6)